MRWSVGTAAALVRGESEVTPARGASSWRTLVRTHAPGALIAAVALAATLGALKFYHGVRPLQTWLFIDLAKIWGWQLLLSVACSSAGYALLDSGLRLKRLPALEKLALALPLGLICFVVGMYLGGYAGLYGRRFAIALPTLMLAAGAPFCLETFVRWQKTRVRARGPGLVSVVAIVFGVFGVGMIYLGVMSPDAVNYDASWNHLVIAQDYARAGRIVPFPADWVKNVPHLGSVLNTWAFLVPGFDQPAQRWMMALHDEFTVLLWTLVGVAAGARFVADRTRLPGAWAAMFLFPSLFVSDGNLGGAADHFLALFVVPVFLAGARCLEAFDWRRAVLVGLFAGGALLTKFQAFYVLVPLGVVLGARVGWLAASRLRGKTDSPPLSRLLGAAGSGLAAFLLLVSLHFVKNAVFYRNPFYPLAQKWFPSTPSFPGAKEQFDYLFSDWRWLPPAGTLEKLKEGVELSATFSFTPHYSFAGNAPVFGSLFTLCLPILLFVGKARRLWLGTAVALGILMTWACTFRVDRHLQMAIPLFAVVTVGILSRAWERGPAARLGVAALVGLQVVWGADYWFSGSDRIGGAMSLIRSGMEGRAESRISAHRRDYIELGKSLPKDAVVLLHRQHVMLGIDRPVLTDLMGLQGLIDHTAFKTARDYYLRLREVGATHIVWSPATDAMSLQEATVFEALAAYHAPTMRCFGWLCMSPLAPTPPPMRPALDVLVLSIGGYRDGLYAVDTLSTAYEAPPAFSKYPAPKEPATERTDLAALAERADVVVLGSGRALPNNPLGPPSDLELLRSPPRALAIYGHRRKMVFGDAPR